MPGYFRRRAVRVVAPVVGAARAPVPGLALPGRVPERALPGRGPGRGGPGRGGGAGAPGAGGGAGGGASGRPDSASSFAPALSTGSFAVPSHTTNQRWFAAPCGRLGPGGTTTP